MLRKGRTRLVLLLIAPIFVACSAAMMKVGSRSPDGSGNELDGCFRDTDCPGGLVCSAAGICVASDGLPPEQQTPNRFLRPATSEHYVFALSPDDSSVAVIDPVTLAIHTVPLPEEPLDLQVLRGKDAAIIVSRAGQSISSLDCATLPCVLKTQRTSRHYPAVSVSSDAQWAVLWTPDGQVPDQGAEGIVGVVDLAALTAGSPAAIVERACGRRHTEVFFKTELGAATSAVIVGESEIAVIDLSQLATQPLPQRLPLAAEYSAVATRQVVVAPDGTWVLFGSLTSQNIGVFVVGMTMLQPLALMGSPTDIELSTDGRTAIAALRDAGTVVSFPLPDALTDASLVKSTPVAIPAVDCAPAATPPCTASAGQVSLSADGKLAALFTTARKTKSFAVLDLETGNVKTFDALAKLVSSVSIGSDGHSAIAIHSAEPGSTLSDPYERTVAVSEGYSVVDLQAGVAQLKLTGAVPPQVFVFSGDGHHAAVTLRSDVARSYAVDTIDLQTLVTSTLSLASAPEFAGAFDDTTARVWITQKHAAGRISFVNLASREVRTATGYTLNAGIQP